MISAFEQVMASNTARQGTLGGKTKRAKASDALGDITNVQAASTESESQPHTKWKKTRRGKSEQPSNLHDHD